MELLGRGARKKYLAWVSLPRERAKYQCATATTGSAEGTNFLYPAARVIQAAQRVQSKVFMLQISDNSRASMTPAAERRINGPHKNF